MGKEKIEQPVDGNTSVECGKSCFIITPVGDKSSKDRRMADGVIEVCIRPVLEELKFQIHVPHKLTTPGSITKDIINKIINDDLVIANLTGLNANVMYEIGIRHSKGKPIVHICEENTTLPFDVGTDRTLFYKNDMFGVNEMKPQLKKFINDALSEEHPSNPVFDAMSRENLFESFKAGDGTEQDKLYKAVQYLINDIDSIKNYISNSRRTGINRCIIDSEGRIDMRDKRMGMNHNLVLDYDTLSRYDGKTDLNGDVKR